MRVRAKVPTESLEYLTLPIGDVHRRFVSVTRGFESGLGIELELVFGFGLGLGSGTGSGLGSRVSLSVRAPMAAPASEETSTL